MAISDKTILIKRVFVNGLNKTVGVKVNPNFDTIGATINADIFVKGDAVKTATVASGVSGVAIRGDMRIDLDFTGVSAGVYSLKIVANSIGVIAKGWVHIKE